MQPILDSHFYEDHIIWSKLSFGPMGENAVILLIL